MSYTVYAEHQVDAHARKTTELGNWSDYDTAAAKAEDFHESEAGSDPEYVAVWIEDEHGNVPLSYDLEDEWLELMNEIYTEPHGY